MKDKFDLIIFDWDGTLVDSIDWIVHCLQTAAKDHGYDVPDEKSAKHTIGLSIEEAMATLFPEAEQKVHKHLVESYEKAFFSQDISEKNLFGGIEQMLSLFKQQNIN